MHLPVILGAAQHGRSPKLIFFRPRTFAVNELLIKDLLIKNDDLGWMIDKYIDDQSKPNECYAGRPSRKDRARPQNPPAH